MDLIMTLRNTKLRLSVKIFAYLRITSCADCWQIAAAAAAAASSFFLTKIK